MRLIKDRHLHFEKETCECSDSILSTSHTKSLDETIQIQDDAKKQHHVKDSGVNSATYR